jgi:hypothetical protein
MASEYDLDEIKARLAYWLKRAELGDEDAKRRVETVAALCDPVIGPTVAHEDLRPIIEKQA